MTDKILEKMTKGVYYPGNHLGRKTDLSILEEKGLLQRMDGSFLCGPDSEPNSGLLTSRNFNCNLFGRECQRHPGTGVDI